MWAAVEAVAAATARKPSDRDQAPRQASHIPSFSDVLQCEGRTSGSEPALEEEALP